MELTSIPWNLVACAVVGIWLMVSPAALGLTGMAAANGPLVGALVVTFAVIGFGESARAARWANILFGAWLLISPWALGGGPDSLRWLEPVAGIAVIALTPRRGPVMGRFAGWDPFVV
jgi:hypothetical protein